MRHWPHAWLIERLIRGAHGGHYCIPFLHSIRAFLHSCILAFSVRQQIHELLDQGVNPLPAGIDADMRLLI